MTTITEGGAASDSKTQADPLDDIRSSDIDRLDPETPTRNDVLRDFNKLISRLSSFASKQIAGGDAVDARRIGIALQHIADAWEAIAFIS